MPRNTNGAATTPMEREERLTRIAEKRRLGYTLEQIGRQEGISAVMVWKEERKLIRRLQERQVSEYADYVALRCDEYRAMRKEAWKEWYRSRRDAVKLTTEEGIAGGEDAEPSSLEVMRLVKRVASREGRLAEAGYLNVILKTWEQEDRLRGFVKNTVSVTNNNTNVNANTPNLQDLLDAPPDPVAERLAAAQELPERPAGPTP
ncbi:MAG TPA: hypothetical protein VD929_08080 [Caulobacteraceae bacterium]|nr:hypothetical protein [Caulobacteraceae bacterium]